MNQRRRFVPLLFMVFKRIVLAYASVKLNLPGNKLVNLIILGNALSFAGSVHAGLVPYTSIPSFTSAYSLNHAWGFEDVTPDSSLVTNVSGPGVISLVQGRVDNFPRNATLLTGNYLYLNPQAVDGDFTFSAPTVDVFGFSVVWVDRYNPTGVVASFYDFQDQLIDYVTMQASNSINSGVFAGSTFYEGFIGVASSTPISRVKMTTQLGGSVFFDNLLWKETPLNDVSIPATLPLLSIALLALGYARQKPYRCS